MPLSASSVVMLSAFVCVRGAHLEHSFFETRCNSYPGCIFTYVLQRLHSHAVIRQKHSKTLGKLNGFGSRKSMRNPVNAVVNLSE